MSGIPPFLLDAAGKDVVVEAYAGKTGAGTVQYAAPVTVRMLVDATRRFVRDANGNQVVSETTLYAPLDTVCPPQSRVTVPGKPASTVITVAELDGGTLPVPSHLEVALQ